MNRAMLNMLALLVLVGTVQAQSSGDLNEGTRITTGNSAGTYNYSWWGQPGRTYFIQHSEDLSIWEYLPLIESGANGPLGWGFSSSASKFFLRLRYSDIPTSDPFHADFDGDKVSNYDELVLGTDPLLALDTDFNGLPDDWEKFYFGHTGAIPLPRLPAAA